jgi:hypothetical protein
MEFLEEKFRKLFKMILDQSFSLKVVKGYMFYNFIMHDIEDKSSVKFAGSSIFTKVLYYIYDIIIIFIISFICA